MKYIYEHYDAFKLIACCSVGTKYENYIERLTEIETKSGTVLLHLLKKENRMTVDMDDTLFHIISNTIFTGILKSFHTIIIQRMRKSISMHYMIFTQQVGTKF